MFLVMKLACGHPKAIQVNLRYFYINDTILLVELIDDNGSILKKIVFKYSNQWKLGDEFLSWLLYHFIMHHFMI